MITAKIEYTLKGIADMKTIIASPASSMGPIPIISVATKTAQPVIGTSILTGAEVESQM